MRVLIATTHVPFVDGGAEAMDRSLTKALKARGHAVETLRIPFKWYPPERIHEHLLACRLLDVQESNGVPIDRVIGFKFPAYHVRHPNKVNWILHQHRTAFEMWGTELCDLSIHPDGKAIRDSINAIERKLLPEARSLYTISQTVTDRLQKYCDLSAKTLYHPPENEDVFYGGETGDYLYFPSRMNKWKRQHLAIEALAQTRKPVKIRFSGLPDNPEFLQHLKDQASRLKVENRISFLGRLPFEEMVDQYANSRGVLFIPENEDYGYITLEAMLSSKPVITCSDSGGPTEFIRHGKEGFVCDPDPASIAKSMDALWESTAFAKDAGKKALDRYREMDISWDKIVDTLLG